jgi:hypothetical protein
MSQYLKNVCPLGTVITYTVVHKTDNGTYFVRYMTVSDGKIVDLTVSIGRHFNNYVEKREAVKTQDPTNVISSLAIALHGDHNALKSAKL